jgi:hypothetical protein
MRPQIPNYVIVLNILPDIHLLTPLNVCVSFFSLERYRQKNDVLSYCSLPNYWHCTVKLNHLQISNSHNLIHNSCRYGGSGVSGPDEKLSEEGQELLPAPLVELVVPEEPLCILEEKTEPEEQHETLQKR